MSLLDMSALESSNLFSVKDQVVVITGGGSGLGAYTALALDVNGASKVFILGRRQASLEKVALQAGSLSIPLPSCNADLGAEKSIRHTHRLRRQLRSFVEDCR